MRNLPDHIQTVDIEEWENINPEDFFRRQHIDSGKYITADRGLKYSRLEKNATYDQIGFRFIATLPAVGIVKLQTLQSVKLRQIVDARLKSNQYFETLNDQEDYLEHRPIEFLKDTRARYNITEDFFKIWATNDPDQDDICWIFPLTTPPDLLLHQSVNQDVSELVTQKYSINIPEVHWLPLVGLVDSGVFPRMQECREKLVQGTSPGYFYCFISHRWLTPVKADPKGLQAGLIAWQLVSYLCEAVRVAWQRGLHKPRKYNPNLNLVVGMAGTDLAESIIVNLLRPNLDESSLNEAYQEIEAFSLPEDEYGVQRAVKDTNLATLKRLLDKSPILKKLSERFMIWYDYSCMPQRPFEKDDEDLFRRNLELLNALQVIGPTLILLDEVEDFLSRAWCTLEAVFADNQTVFRWFTLVGSSRKTAARGKTEHYFSELLQDRPHIIWRAILDTELFETQTPMECMERLGLSATLAEDLPFIYDRLKKLRVPTKVHADDSEVITGVFPLPILGENGEMLAATTSERQVDEQAGESIQEIKSLDWTKLLDTSESIELFKGQFSEFYDGFLDLQKGSATPANGYSHVCVFAGCEGEAILVSNWVKAHQTELTEVLGIEISSLSWIASDIAPVGKFVRGSLETCGLYCDTWIIIGSQRRLDRGKAALTLANTLRDAGQKVITMNYDLAENNIEVFRTPSQKSNGENFKIINQDNLKVHHGGLFRWSFLDNLVD